MREVTLCACARRSAGSGSMSGAELAEALAGAAADQVTVLKPLEVHSHEGIWRRAVWCAALSQFREMLRAV